MSVLLADSDRYELRRRTTADDASGYPVPSWPTDPDWTGEGYADEQPDRSFKISLDVSAGPVSYNDQVTLPDGTPVLVRTSNHNPGDPNPVWDPVRAIDCTAVRRDLAQHPREEQGAQQG